MTTSRREGHAQLRLRWQRGHWLFGSNLHEDIIDYERVQSMLKTPTIDCIDHICWGRELKEMVSA
jgi:hypothetical protein